MGGGGGRRPAAVRPTVNTSNVQHLNTGANHLGGTAGGKGGLAHVPQPQAQPYGIGFQGYGARGPYGFGMLPPQQAGFWGQQLGGSTQAQRGGQALTQNQFGQEAAAQNQERESRNRAHELAMAGRDPRAEGSALGQKEQAAYADTVGQAAGVEGYDPNTDVLGPEKGNFSMGTEAGQAQSAIYNNQLADTKASGGAQAGGFKSRITGKGDDWGSSLSTGRQSNVGLQDRGIALGEKIGNNVPGLIGKGVGMATDAVASRVAPKSQYQKDDRTAQEVSIDRHTKRYADSGKKFDMNDPSTWIKKEDKVNLKNKDASHKKTGKSGGSKKAAAKPKPAPKKSSSSGGGGGSSSSGGSKKGGK